MRAIFLTLCTIWPNHWSLWQKGSLNQERLLSYWSARLNRVIDLMTALSSRKCLATNFLECNWDCGIEKGGKIESLSIQALFRKSVLDFFFFFFSFFLFLIEWGTSEVWWISRQTSVGSDVVTNIVFPIHILNILNAFNITFLQYYTAVPAVLSRSLSYWTGSKIFFKLGAF